MLIQEEDFSIEILEDEKRVVFKGTMRLNSPLAYDQHLNTILNILKNSSTFTFDISELDYLNSSGLTSLGRLFIQAKGLNVKATLLGSKNIPWHDKSMASIARLWPGLEIVLK